MWRSPIGFKFVYAEWYFCVLKTTRVWNFSRGCYIIKLVFVSLNVPIAAVRVYAFFLPSKRTTTTEIISKKKTVQTISEWKLFSAIAYFPHENQRALNTTQRIFVEPFTILSVEILPQLTYICLTFENTIQLLPKKCRLLLYHHAYI